MDYVDCPECLSRAKRMPVLSAINSTDDFYLCEACSRVSIRAKGETMMPAEPVRLTSAAAPVLPRVRRT